MTAEQPPSQVLQFVPATHEDYEAYNAANAARSAVRGFFGSLYTSAGDDANEWKKVAELEQSSLSPFPGKLYVQSRNENLRVAQEYRALLANLEAQSSHDAAASDVQAD